MSKTGMVEGINKTLIEKMFCEATKNKRKRKNYNLHAYDDSYQRFINVIAIASYMRPHKHAPKDDETFVILEGTCFIVIFIEGGGIHNTYLMEDGKGGSILDNFDNNFEKNFVVDIPGDVWHTLIPITHKVVIMETKAGPYDPNKSKEYASWAPEEHNLEICADYNRRLCRNILELLPKEPMDIILHNILGILPKDT